MTIFPSLSNDIERLIQEPDVLLPPNLARADLQDSFSRPGRRDLHTKDFGVLAVSCVAEFALEGLEFREVRSVAADREHVFAVSEFDGRGQGSVVFDSSNALFPQGHNFVGVAQQC